MTDEQSTWTNTTHDWAAGVDLYHLDVIRRSPRSFAPNGLLHLVFEVLAYPADEAEDRGAGHCIITFHEDGSISVADDGRGTDTRADEAGQFVKKPVMATKDLRFFDGPASEILPDGFARRGMSIVAALSEWLEHENRRSNGAWRQRYERGIPVTELEPITGPAVDSSTGTTVRFLPIPSLLSDAIQPIDLTRWAEAQTNLVVEVRDERGPSTG
jgi:DNA gyrase subunit B